MLKKNSHVMVMLFVFALGIPVFALQDPPPLEDAPPEIRRVKRARRPVFDGQKSNKMFFKDAYAEGTSGARPEVQIAEKSSDSGTSSSGSGGGSGRWSQIIDANAIEDEVKLLHRELSQLLTTPVVFQTKYNEVRNRFEVLSMLFAIIRQYDGDVRWSKYSGAAQVLFQQAAVSSRTGTTKGFQYCKARHADLQELVRGGSIETKDAVSETVDWGTVADRTPIMVRLEFFNEQLKGMTSNQSEFASNAGKIDQMGNLIAAMAEVLAKEDMPDSEEDDYVAYSVLMGEAADLLRKAAKTNDFAGASKAANMVSQSCSDCHADWR